MLNLLSKAAKDWNENVRCASLEGVPLVGEKGDPKLAEVLLGGLGDYVLSVRLAAAQALCAFSQRPYVTEEIVNALMLMIQVHPPPFLAPFEAPGTHLLRWAFVASPVRGL